MGKLQSNRTHWNAFWKKNNLLYVNKTIEVLEKTTSLNGKKIIEMGAGSGATSIKISSMGAVLTCLDYSDQSLELIKKNYKEAAVDIALLKADVENLPIKEGSYDICFHQGLLEHFRNPLLQLKEQFRILKPGGLLLVDVPQRYSFYTIIKKYKMLRRTWFAGWETEYDNVQLKKLLISIGFEYVQSYGRYHFRNIDRVQLKFLKRRIIPGFVERIYYKLICKLENTSIGRYTSFSIGMVVRKSI
jgi:ubiquinone/menaquinone biosynthesis C-methylase UbiE